MPARLRGGVYLALARGAAHLELQLALALVQRLHHLEQRPRLLAALGERRLERLRLQHRSEGAHHSEKRRGHTY